jgi:hypothetical protein
LWDIFHRRLRKATDVHGRGFRLRIDWTLGHVDIPGNEAADAEAKRAARTGSFGNTLRVLQRLPYAKSALAQTHTQLLKKAASKHYKKSPRQARITEVDPSAPSSKFRKLTAKLPRKHAALLFQLRSHHAPLAKHLHRLSKSPSPICPCCNETVETVEHFLHFCSAHAAARRELHKAGRLARFTKHLLTDPKLLPDLFHYIQRSGRFHAVFGDFKEIPRPDDENK